MDKLLTDYVGKNEKSKIVNFFCYLLNIKFFNFFIKYKFFCFFIKNIIFKFLLNIDFEDY